jgi:hypothetical protein
MLQFQEHLPAGKVLPTFVERCKMIQQSVLRPQVQQYAVVLPTQFNELDGWADCVDGFIQVVKQTNKTHIIPVGAIVGLAHLVPENAPSGSINCEWLVNNHIDQDTYWTVY